MLKAKKTLIELCDKCGIEINYDKLGFEHEKVENGISLNKVIYCKGCYFSTNGTIQNIRL